MPATSAACSTPPRHAVTRSSPGTTRAPATVSASSTRRRSRHSGTARPTWTGRSRWTRRGSPVKTWGEKEWLQFQLEAFNWRMSQFLHGEQGALLCTGKIVVTTPWIDAKYYAASQVMDEARHV